MSEGLRTFKVGTCEGLTRTIRREIWLNQPIYLNKVLKIKYKLAGTKDRPRQPIGIGLRSPQDTG